MADSKKPKRTKKYCKRCDSTKPLTEFRLVPFAYCKPCDQKRTSDLTYARRAKVREWIQEYLEEHPCLDCGEADIQVLEFDHVRGEKRMSVAELSARHGLPVVQEEVAKCEVVCANCHRKRTQERGGHWRHGATPARRAAGA